MKPAFYVILVGLASAYLYGMWKLWGVFIRWQCQ